MFGCDFFFFTFFFLIKYFLNACVNLKSYDYSVSSSGENTEKTMLNFDKK